MTKVDSLRLKALAAYSLLKARARTEYAEADIKLEALASAAVLVAYGSADALSVAVRATLLELSNVDTGKFFILINLDDAFSAIEQHKFDISKLRTDEVHAVEKAIIGLAKALADGTSTLDIANRLVGKAVTSLVSSADSDRTVVFAKSRQDTTTALEDLSYNLYKSREDAFLASDLSTNLVGKLTTNVVATADAYDRVVAYVRAFDDSADATDEISVAALTDDGQVMFFAKNINDPATVVETASTYRYQIDLVRADTFIAFEQAVYDFGKPLAHNTITSDSTVAEVGKSVSDIIATSETTIADVSRVSSDAVISSDVLVSAFSKSLFDIVTSSDALTWSVGLYVQNDVTISEIVDVIRIAADGVPPQIENKIITDTYAPNFFKNVAEVLSATDDFDGTTTTEDDQTTAFSKVVVENLSAIELKTFSLQRTNTETVSANDTGVLFWTDYCDSTYFSQGYVGQERTFT